MRTADSKCPSPWCRLGGISGGGWSQQPDRLSEGQGGEECLAHFLGGKVALE